MDASAKTFSESWHKVATVRAALRPSVSAWRQEYRGVQWYVLQDAMSNQFFRVTADAYDFLSRLTPLRTVDEAWRDSLSEDPDRVLSQEEVVQLLGQLYTQNLLYFDRPGASLSLFERYRKRRQRETRAKLMGFLSIKVPLYDPDRLLNKALPLINFLYSPLGWLLYALLLGTAIKALLDNGDALFGQGVGLLAPENLPLLYVGFLLAKIIHEFSHGMACKRFGGEVHIMGVMFLVMTPMPYVDASASWGFREGWKRLLVAASGMIGEFALAAVAALVWVNTAPGVLNALAYNVMFVASVSTLLFNMNPLLRFDGYYMFVDLFAVPNLFQRSREQLRYLGERYLFGVRKARPAARTRGEARLLPVYAVLSLGYWVVLMGTIVWFVASEYLDIGMILAAFLLVLFLVVPLVKFLNYLFLSPRLMQQRPRALAVTGGLLLCGVLLLGLWPVADRVRAPGVLEARDMRQVNSETAGFLADVLAKPGAWVQAGTPLVQLENEGLDLEITLAELQRRQILAQELKAESAALADLSSLRRQRAAVEDSLADLRRRKAGLVITAPIEGRWVAPQFEQGAWMERGGGFGEVVDNRAFRLVAVVPQVASHLFDARIHAAEIRLVGEEGINVHADGVRVIPFEHGELPSPALGMPGGGTISVAPEDTRGVTASEPFFRIHAGIPAAGPLPSLLHGRLGEMRLTLDPKPLLWQWERALRQFLQRNFHV